jgi:hypothetical protein
MDTEPVKISLKGEATPHCVTVARKVPFPLMSAVKAELKRMLDCGVIRQVTEPTDWCAAMVPVRKKNGQVRICVDLKHFNQEVRREHFTLPNIDDIAPKLSGAKYFTTLDAASGFWQIPLEESSQLLTTFMTPFGRYCFRRIPFGITSAPEIFQRKMTEMLNGLEGVVVIMDDILVYGNTLEEHDYRLSKVLETIKKSGLCLNKEKCHFRQTEVTYFGHQLSQAGLRPDPDKVEAMTKLRKPTNVTELRTTLGMFQYLGKFGYNLSTIMKPMTDLLKSDVVWTWGPKQEASFNKTKDLLCKAPTLAFYNPHKRTVVSADASSFGLGAVLLQSDSDDDKLLQPVAFASRTLNGAEQRYAQIEKECLASVWACEKFAKYLVGLKEFTLLTDHKPLVPLLSKKNIDEAPIRCQRLLLRMMRFNPTTRHVPGKEMVISDALSRAPLQDTGKDTELASEVEAYVDMIQLNWPVLPARISQIKKTMESDEVLGVVAEYIVNGWPRREESVPMALCPYYQVKAELSVVDGLLVYRDRIVVPTEMRQEVLACLHESHQGISKCRERAESAIWWPQISRDIKALVEQCKICCENRKSQQEQPLKPTVLPERPWSQLATDILEFRKKTYMVVVDYYSRWIDIKFLPNITSKTLIGKFKSLFATHGIPDVLISDNATPYVSSEFQDFVKAWGFSHHTSNPYRPQENGLAERGVQTAKKILGLDDPELGLLNYHATPHSTTGVPPAVALMGRQIQTRLPTLTRHLLPKLPNEDVMRKSDKSAKLSYKYNFDAHQGARPLPVLEEGDSVLIKLDSEKKWSKPSKVIGSSSSGRSCLVQTEDGVTYQRARKHLQKVPESVCVLPDQSEPVSVNIHVPENSGAEHPPEPSADLPVGPARPATPLKSVDTSRKGSTPIKQTSRGRPIRLPHRYRSDE